MIAAKPQAIGSSPLLACVDRVSCLAQCSPLHPVHASPQTADTLRLIP
ncbi:hypothetical protein MKP08_01630 [Erythrobacter sp. LQ02-29]|nr:hypothetical protein [Erythrobacter sp. LQ02-29]MCP9221449.1 hypothetical protein [Erythrobacter sp. LQ02-29]